MTSLLAPSLWFAMSALASGPATAPPPPPEGATAPSAPSDEVSPSSAETTPSAVETATEPEAEASNDTGPAATSPPAAVEAETQVAPVRPPAHLAVSAEATPPSPPPKTARRVGPIVMTAVGFSVFGASYAISSLTGAIVADARDGERLDRFGRRMLIPVVGPWLAIPHTESATGAWFTGFAGAAQLAGLVLGTVGAVRLGQQRRESQRWAVTSTPLLGGGQLGVVGRF